MKKKIALLLILIMITSVFLCSCGAKEFEVTTAKMYSVNTIKNLMSKHDDYHFVVSYNRGSGSIGEITGAYVKVDGNTCLEYISTLNEKTTYAMTYVSKDTSPVTYAYQEGSEAIVVIDPKYYDDVIANSAMALSDLSAEEKQIGCELQGNTYVLTTKLEAASSGNYMICKYTLDKDTLELVSTEITNYNKSNEITLQSTTEVKFDTGYKLTFESKKHLIPEETLGTTELTVVFNGKDECYYGHVVKSAQITASGLGTYYMYNDPDKKNSVTTDQYGYVLKDSGIKDTIYAFN